MKLLLDTHLLLWTGVSGNDTANGSLPTEVSALIKDETNALYFSPASVWEVAIKNALGRADFRVDPHLFRRALLDNGYIELLINRGANESVGRVPL
ncbi:PIN domain nuclease [Candidatus Accumulibacter contiguus]|jgi:PIN domain nuclease of toxin-antitoxin system|uniref:PIN domain nuclease n=1 Tax=Candidatus Accumulibacter contiguus TaxID=2954381 RepID=UPI002FC34B0A